MNDQLAIIQGALWELGIPAGPVDGIWGRKTDAAFGEVLFRTRGRWGDPVEGISRALADLGYLDDGAVGRAWDDDIDHAMRLCRAAKGRARASTVHAGDRTRPAAGYRPDHGNVIRQGRAGYIIDTFVQHTTATPGDWWKGKTNREMFDAVRRWHVVDNGWREIGYHGVIFPDGEVIEGRPWAEIGAHVREANRGSLGYSMVPIKTIERMGVAAEFYTPESLAAMRAVIARACAATQIATIAGHNVFSPKLCPGFVVRAEDWAPDRWEAA